MNSVRPTLDAVLHSPQCLDSLSVDVIHQLQIEAAAVVTVLAVANGTTPSSNGAPALVEKVKKYITPDEAAVIARCDRRYFYKHKGLSYVHRRGRHLLIDEDGLRRSLERE